MKLLYFLTGILEGLDIQGEQENNEIREDANQNNSEEKDEHDTMNIITTVEQQLNQHSL